MLARFARLVVGALCAASISALPAGAAASPQDLFGFGGRTPGLAMTGTSYAEGYEAVFANPAGLAAARHNGLSVGMHGAGYRLTLDGQGEPVTPARGMSIGFHLPLPFGDLLEDRLVFGGGFFTPSDVLLRGRVLFPERVQFSILDRAQVLAVQVGLGIDLHGLVDGLQIGVAVSALANVFGDLDVGLDETNAFSSVVETQLTTSFAPIIGARYTQENWGIGLTYRHELAARMELEIRTRDLPVALPVLTVGGLVQYDPPTLIAEGFWRPIPDLMLVLNLTTRFWDAWPGAQVQTSMSSWVAPEPEAMIIPSPRIAVEGQFVNDLFTLQLRGGYAFEASPLRPGRMAAQRTPSGEPREEGGEPVMVPLRYLDNDRHILTAGTGLVWRFTNSERLSLDFYGQLHVLAPREHEIPASSEATDPMRTAGYILVGGWTATLEF